MARTHGGNDGLEEYGKGYRQPQNQSVDPKLIPSIQGASAAHERPGFPGKTDSRLNSGLAADRLYVVGWVRALSLGFLIGVETLVTVLARSPQQTGTVSFKPHVKHLVVPSTKQALSGQAWSEGCGPGGQPWNAGLATHSLCEFGKVA